MIKQLLVPLDGSSLAEGVLPATAYLAQHLGATVTLLHVIEHNAPTTIHGQPHLTNISEAERYLRKSAEDSFPSDVKVTWHIHPNEIADVARSLVEHTEELGIDLVVMCSHGRGGLRDVLFGSIAQQVVALGRHPVLLIPPTSQPFALHRALVPLDGQPAHEQGLPFATELAHICQAELLLVQVIPILGTLTGTQAATGRLLPGAMTEALNLGEQESAKYLFGKRTRLENAGLRVHIAVFRGEPVETIVKAAQSTATNLIVLTTHGRTGLSAFWAGSLATKIFSQANLPLLLLPVVDRKPEETHDASYSSP